MSLNVEKIQNIDPNKWDEFCLKNSRCNFYHFLISKIKEDNHSLVVSDNQVIMAIIPLIKEETTFSLFGLSLPAPVIAESITGEKHIKKVLNLIMDSIDQVAVEEKIKKVMFNDLFNGGNLKNNYLDSSLLTISLDLTLEEDVLWRNLSKGHRSDIKKRGEEFKIKWKNQKNSDLGFETFDNLLITITEKSKKESKLLHYLYQNNCAEFAFLYESDQKVAGTLFLKFNNRINYYCAHKFITTNVPVHHYLLWESLLEYKAQNYQFLDLGIFSETSSIHYINDSKKKAIATFKKGFGGKIRKFPLETKYFSLDCFQQDYSQKITNYANNIFS